MELERRRDAEPLPAYPSNAGADSAEIESAEIQAPARDGRLNAFAYRVKYKVKQNKPARPAAAHCTDLDRHRREMNRTTQSTVPQPRARRARTRRSRQGNEQGKRGTLPSCLARELFGGAAAHRTAAWLGLGLG